MAGHNHPLMQVQTLNPRDETSARQLHALWTLAHAQESALLGMRHFLPLERTLQDLQASEQLFLGAMQETCLLGALSLAPDDEPAQTQITALLVHPMHQRRGIARALVKKALDLGGDISVVTGARNAPALALYQGLGCEPYRWGTLGAQELPMVKLRRQA